VNALNLEYVRTHLTHGVDQTEYAIRFPMAAPQEDVNTYSTRRILWLYAGADEDLVAEDAEGVPRVGGRQQRERVHRELGL